MASATSVWERLTIEASTPDPQHRLRFTPPRDAGVRVVMASPATTGWATSILTTHQGCGPDATSVELRHRWRRTNRKVRDIAEDRVLTSALSGSAGDAR